MSLILSIFTFFFGISAVFGQCPQDDPDLIPWNPHNDLQQDLVVDNEKLLLVSDSLEARSITITNGGKLVIDDSGDDKYIGAKYILIEYEGELHIGSEDCHYKSGLQINLLGRRDDEDLPDLSAFGSKVLAVAPNGTLEIHGSHKTSWTRLSEHLYPIEGEDEVILNLQSEVKGWGRRDRIVVASTDYDLYQSEELGLVSCGECESNQVKIEGPVLYHHYAGEVNGVEIYAEVGLLSRNIVIEGEHDTNGCYGDLCEWFDVDIFGGQTQFLTGFRSVHIEGVEFVHMGQQELGHYPVHFHRAYDVDEVGGYDPPTYVRQISISQSYSRCVTLHATHGLLVEDVVGFDNFGHCFFLEDGMEQRNTIRHNLAISTRRSLLLPTDRDEDMCDVTLGDTWGDYVPNSQKECRFISAYWIAHPNNNVVDNVAVGADVGFLYVMHRVPTGPSIGLLPEYHAERSPMGEFRGNVAHSNSRMGFNLDLGVKTTDASEEDPREFLSAQMTAKYMPHENTDPLQPRVTAVMKDFTSYKNNGVGIHARGGDISFTDCRLADNGIGIMFSSDSTWPHDAGSHQEATGCILVGESENRGTDSPRNLYYGLGADGQPRSLPLPPTIPQRGLVFWEGPAHFSDFDIHSFAPTSERNNSVISFLQRTSDQTSPKNSISNLRIDQESLPVYMGQEGDLFGSYDSDADLNQIFYDVDGSVTGYPNSYVVRPDNWLLRTDDCIDVPEYNAAICTEQLNYPMLHITASDKRHNLTINRDGYEDAAITLSGATLETDISEPVDTNTYQPVMMDRTQYVAEWSGQPPPDQVTILLANFELSEQFQISFRYPSGTSFHLTYDEWLQMEDVITNEEDLVAGESFDELVDDKDGMTYYWDEVEELLVLKLKERNERDSDDHWNICTPSGCPRIHIYATYATM